MTLARPHYSRICLCISTPKYAIISLVNKVISLDFISDPAVQTYPLSPRDNANMSCPGDNKVRVNKSMFYVYKISYKQYVQRDPKSRPLVKMLEFKWKNNDLYI